MLINCVICSDLFINADDICCTPCGHLFHYQCLIQWIERSNSCPQCRAKTKEANIHRVFLNVMNNGTTEDASLLQNKIDSLSFQIRLKNTDIKNASERNELLNTQNVGLRDEIKKLQAKIKEQVLIVTALKEQTQTLRKQNKDAELALNECKNLRTHVDFLTGVETVVKGTTAEVEDMLNNYGVSLDSTRALATYVAVLKKEMNAKSKKLKECENTLNTNAMERKKVHNKLTAQININKQLEQDLLHAENIKKSLVKKLKSMQEAMMSPTASNPSASALRRLITESPAPESVKKPTLSDPADDITPVLTCNSPVKNASPYLNVKSSSIGLTPLRGSNTTVLQTSNKFSIFKKARLTTQSTSAAAESVAEVAYDGFGGHSKLDEFPKPIPKVRKIKRHVIGSVSKMKIKDIPPNIIKMDTFIQRLKQ